MEYEAAEVLDTDVSVKDPAFYPLDVVPERSGLSIIGAPRREHRELRLDGSRPVVDVRNVSGRGALLT